MPSRLYTNADADRQYWANRPDGGIRIERPTPPVDSLSGLNDAVGEPSFDELMQRITESNARIDRLKAETELMPSHGNDVPETPFIQRVGNVVGPVAGDVAKGAGLVAASSLGGPLGWGADAYMAYDGLKNAVQHPGVGSAIGAALGMIPGLGAIRNLRKAATGAKAAEDAVGTLDRFMPNKSGFTGPPKGMEIPKPGGVPYAHPTEFQAPGLDPHMPNQPAASHTANPEDAAGQVQSMLDQWMSNASAYDTPAASHVPTTAVNGSGESAASLEALNRQASMARQGRQFGVVDRAGRFRPLIGPEAVDYVPQRGESFGVMSNGLWEPLTENGGRAPSALTGIEDATTPVDWRQVPPELGGRANFVKQYADKTQQELLQMLGERDFGFADKGIHLKQVKQPIYPEGDSKVDKLAAAIRQREKLMGMRD